MRKVNELIETGHYSQAIAILTQCLDENTPNPSVYSSLGLAYFLASEYAKAQEIWAYLLLSFDDGMESLVNAVQDQANACLQKRQFQVAQSLWEVILDLEESATALASLGDSLAQQGLYNEAINSWNKALALDSSIIDIYHRQGAVLQALKEFDQAIKVYQNLLAIAPENIEGLYQLSLAFQALGQDQKGLDCLNQCLALGSEQGRVLGEIGALLLRNGYYETAFQYLRNAVRKNLYEFKSVLAGLEQIIALQSTSAQELLFIRHGLLNSLIEDTGFEFFGQQLIALNQSLRTEQVIIDALEISALDGFYESTKDWIIEQKMGDFWPGLPESFISLAPPRTLDEFIHFSFRFGVGVSLPESFVVSIPGGRVWLNKDESRMAVITSHNYLLGDISPESPALSPGHPDKHPSRHSLLQGRSMPPVQSVAGTVAVLSGLLNDVYFHWLFDVLPRFHLLRLAGWDWKNIDWFLVNDRCGFQRESLAILGVDPHKLLQRSSGEDVHLQADRLLVPSFPGTVAWTPKWACDFLRNTFLDSEWRTRKTNKRLYIRRNLSSSRRLINEEEVISGLESWGFEALHLELLSVREQASLFAQAEIIVAPHGSGLSNLVFCPPGTKVIEIFSPFYTYPCFWLVSNLMELDYFYVLGEILGGQHFHQFVFGADKEGDIWVDCQRLLRVLRLAIGE
ncbi:MAG: DUF563 domain-containing protein [Cyanobacteria bacterium RI_101]|nr:DUF563 domain-containing protein [Cyanobacteria bacterium RI_101]